MRFAILIEETATGFPAYAPDLPGCVATAASVKDVEQEMREAIRFHIGGLKEDGLPVPGQASLSNTWMPEHAALVTRPLARV